MRRVRHSIGLLGRPLRSSSGLTFVEVVLVAGVSIGVVIAAAVAYVGTTRSWSGTSALLELQRDASLAVEIVQRGVRPASTVDVSADGDSIAVFYPVSGGESLAARFYVDADGYVRDMNGTAISGRVDSLGFRTNGRTLHMDIVLHHDLDTAQRTTDDQRVHVSSSVVCRNW